MTGHLPESFGRRMVGMIVGIIIVGLGIALFKQSHLGNDAFNALTIRLSELTGLSLGVQNLLTNIILFILECIWGRKYIGPGTLVNGMGIGFIVTLFYDPISAWCGPARTLPVQLLWVALAIPVLALGASLYQTADLGIAPYDFLSLSLRDHTPFPYFGCRVFTDGLFALIAWLLGGLIGLGTLLCAFCLGPFIQFFNGQFSERVLRYRPETV
ncbi:MAG: YitT family protein [Faecalibacterium sp.]